MLDLDFEETLTNKQYHTRPEISKSDLDLLAKSPYHYANKEFKEQTQNMLLGSVTHKLILEPKDFGNEYVIAPDVNKRTKAGREEFEAFLNSLDGKESIDKALYDTASKMSDEVLKMRETARFLRDGKPEQSYFSEIEGVPVKCRPDFYNEKLGLLIDIKTSADASKMGFAKSVANFNYHVQVAFYSDIMESLGHKINKFLFIVVETKEPHLVGFYELDNTAVENGRERYKALLERYKWCKENDIWWGYGEFNDGEINPVQTIGLPTWKFYEEI